MRPGTVFSGDQLDAIDDRLLVRLVQDATVFYRVSPRHKLRIVKVCIIMIIIYTLFSLFLCNTEKKLTLHGLGSYFFLNILIKLQDIYVKLHYNTFLRY